jgi:hypothetical protein
MRHPSYALYIYAFRKERKRQDAISTEAGDSLSKWAGALYWMLESKLRQKRLLRHAATGRTIKSLLLTLPSRIFYAPTAAY